MSDLTDGRIDVVLKQRPDATYHGIGWADRMFDDLRSAVRELQRHRTAQAASKERVMEVVRDALFSLSLAEDVDKLDPGQRSQRITRVAERVADQLATPAVLSAAERAVLEDLCDPAPSSSVLIRYTAALSRIGKRILELEALVEALRCGDLVAFSDGLLSVDRAAAFREHLARCKPCQDGLLDVHALDATVSMLSAARKPAPPRRRKRSKRRR